MRIYLSGQGFRQTGNLEPWSNGLSDGASSAAAARLLGSSKAQLGKVCGILTRVNMITTELCALSKNEINIEIAFLIITFKRCKTMTCVFQKPRNALE